MTTRAARHRAQQMPVPEALVAPVRLLELFAACGGTGVRP